MMMLVLLVKKEKVCVFSVNLSFDKTWQKKTIFLTNGGGRQDYKNQCSQLCPIHQNFLIVKKSSTYHFTYEEMWQISPNYFTKPEKYGEIVGNTDSRNSDNVDPLRIPFFCFFSAGKTFPLGR